MSSLLQMRLCFGTLVTVLKKKGPETTFFINLTTFLQAWSRDPDPQYWKSLKMNLWLSHF
jgi:hypothetical protein